MEDLQEQCSVRHDVIQSSVKNAERGIIALRGQLHSNRQAVNDLLDRLELTQAVTYSSDTRLTEVEQAVVALWDLLKDVRDTLHVLSTHREMLDQTGQLPPGEQLIQIVRTMNSLLFVL